MISAKPHTSNLLHLRYKPDKQNFRNCTPCPAFDLFDWVVWLPDSENVSHWEVENPVTILCLAHRKSLRFLTKNKNRLANATIIIAGKDTNLSEVLPNIERLLPHSCKIYFEAKDIPHPEIKSFCMGLISFYLDRIKPEIISKLVATVADPGWKKQGILASWGAVYGNLDEELEDRLAAVEFVNECNWITREHLEPEKYWIRLAESEYLLAPAGRGIQSPKLAEAWLMRTVPVVTDTPCFRDLYNEGFPLLILDKWESLTKERLQAFNEEKNNIDWLKVQSMLTLEYFRSRYLAS